MSVGSSESAVGARVDAIVAKIERSEKNNAIAINLLFDVQSGRGQFMKKLLK